jgi:2-hydroxy-4-carboxymuconate semialdehyde hemiacetal dehydrogenase
MKKPLKVALAGAGAFGIKHLDGIKHIDDVEVVSLISRDLEKTKGCLLYTSDAADE